MPFINIRVLKGTLSADKKKEMISRVSEIVAEIEARPAKKDNLVRHTWCHIEELPFENWGIGGNPLTPEILKAVLEGTA